MSKAKGSPASGTPGPGARSSSFFKRAGQGMTDKHKLPEELRQLVRAHAGLVETPRADAGLTTLSFQSEPFPERHVWVDTDLDGQIVVDLEDWTTERSWDNSVAHITAMRPTTLAAIIVGWLSGLSLAECKEMGGTEIPMR